MIPPAQVRSAKWNDRSVSDSVAESRSSARPKSGASSALTVKTSALTAPVVLPFMLSGLASLAIV